MATKKKSPKKSLRKAAKRPVQRRATAARKQPETLRLRSANPGFTVNDIHRSLAWYQNVLGCVVVEKWERDGRLLGATLRAGSVDFYLGQDDWKKGRDRVKGEGFRVYCSTSQDIDVLAAAIKRKGGSLLHEPRTEPWGERDFGLIDPDGFKITVSQNR